jgi:pimeloyl-ACP methyl ester carboxylesterase
VSEQFAQVRDDVELCYETFGDPADPTVLLVMGLATQMVAWHEEFCALLVDRGFHVVRFDNRDVGRSSRADGPPPSLKQMLLRDKSAAVYSLSDLAQDAILLLDHLGVAKAHVVGASMGGMIAQTIAIEHPDRVLSLCSIMSNTGGRFSGQPAFSIYPVFLRRPPQGRDAYIESTVLLYDKIGSSGFDRDEAETRRSAALSYDRGVSSAGNGRQLAAILSAPNRRKALGKLKVPTLVIHGTADRLVHSSGGRMTARAVPGAKLLLIEGMGHDLPRGAWVQIADAIAQNAARAAEGAPVPRHAAGGPAAGDPDAGAEPVSSAG